MCASRQPAEPHSYHLRNYLWIWMMDIVNERFVEDPFYVD